MIKSVFADGASVTQEASESRVRGGSEALGPAEAEY